MMSASMESLSPSDTLSRLAGILDCTKEAEAIRVTALAEYIRVCVYQPYYWEVDRSLLRPIHTKRIFSAVRRDVGFLWKDTDHPTFNSEISENVLRRLGEIGDIIELGGGFWAPGPVRIVRAADSRESALVVIGGVPFEALRMKFATRISCIGCGRFIRPDRAVLRCLRIEHELQSVDDWLGWGLSENLPTWTQRTFKSLVENMDPAEAVEASDWDIYAPDNLPGKPGRINWLSIREFGAVPTGLRLCRPPTGKSAIYDRPMYLAELREDGGRATFRRLALVPTDIRLRLMFGFEQMQSVQRTVPLEVVDRICRATISFKLPDPESRILAFGWPVDRDLNGRANVFEFSSDLVPYLIQVLDRLNVRTTTTTS